MVNINEKGIWTVDGNGVGENLILNSMGNTKGNSWVAEGCTLATDGECFKIISTAADRRIYDNVSNVWQSGQIYTVSFFAKAETTGTQINMSRSISDFSQNFTLTKDWEKYIGTINSTLTATGGTLSIKLLSAATVYIKFIKLEKGSVATPWIPNPTDTIYVSDSVGFSEEGNKAKIWSCGSVTGNEFIQF